MFILPLLFPKTITDKVRNFANENTNGALYFKQANLSFFHHFPNLTLTLDGFSHTGCPPFEKENFIKAKEISFGINLSDLIFSKKVNINQIFVEDAFIDVKVNKAGVANYNIYIGNEKKTKSNENTNLELAKINIKNSHLSFRDDSNNFNIDANGFNYLGKGDLNNAIFDLKSNLKITDFNLNLKGEEYLKNKKIDANLITQINTNSLSFLFQENKLIINKLPILFTGKFDFLNNGYNMDLNVSSTKSQLNDFFTALPPQYITWMNKTKIEGETDVLLTIKGKYIVEKNIKPDVIFGMKIRDGFVAYQNAPLPASNILLDFKTKLPALDLNQLRVNLDTIFLNVGTDYLAGKLISKGIQSPEINTKIKSDIDLNNLNKALGISKINIGGLMKINLLSKGIYNQKSGLFPVTNADIKLQNGRLQTSYYPKPITNIQVNAVVKNQNGKFNDLNVIMTPASFLFEGQPFAVQAKLNNFDDLAYNVKVNGAIDLGKIYKVFSQKGLDLKGFIKANVAMAGKQSDATNGRYNKMQNSGTFVLKNIKTQSEYLPKPFVINNGIFKFHNDKLDFKNFNASYGQSDFEMNGSMQNAINFAIQKNAVLKGNFNLNSGFINVDEFMTKAEMPTNNATNISKTNDKASQKSVVVIPPNFDFVINANARTINFEDLKIENLKGKLNINKGKINLQKTTFNIIGSNVTIDANYANKGAEKANFGMNLLTTDFDIKRAYKEVKLFREMVTAAESADGVANLVYKISGVLNNEMFPIFPSLVGGGTVTVKNAKMKGFKVFNAVSQKTSTEALNNPNLKDVTVKTTIKNNIINIERFKMKVAGFRPRIEGQTSFDGRLNIKMRLGLPPFGLIGIPLTITGNKDKLKIKLGKKGEDISETEYKE